jgi:hypothetical protein
MKRLPLLLGFVMVAVAPDLVPAQAGGGVPIIKAPVTREQLQEGLKKNCRDEWFNATCDGVILSVKAQNSTVQMASAAAAVGKFIEALVLKACPKGNVSVPGVHPRNKSLNVRTVRSFAGTEQCLYNGDRPEVAVALHPGSEPLANPVATANGQVATSSSQPVLVVDQSKKVDTTPRTSSAALQEKPEPASAQRTQVQNPPLASSASSVVSVPKRGSTTGASTPVALNPVLPDALAPRLPFAVHSLSRTQQQVIMMLSMCRTQNSKPAGMYATCGRLLEALRQLSLARDVSDVTGLAVYFATLEVVPCPSTMNLIGLFPNGRIDWAGVTRRALAGEMCLRERDTKKFVVSIYCINPTETPTILPDRVPLPAVAVDTPKVEVRDSLHLVAYKDSVRAKSTTGVDRLVTDSAELSFTRPVTVGIKVEKDTTPPKQTVRVDTVTRTIKSNKWPAIGLGFLAGFGAGWAACHNHFVICREKSKPGGPVNPPNNIFDWPMAKLSFR